MPAARGYRRGISDAQRVLKAKGTVCAYCSSRRATTVDHVVPISHLRDNTDDNLVPACFRCNVLASNKVFDSFEAKQLHILDAIAASKGLREARCPNGCGVCYVRAGENDRCPDCGEAL